MLLAFLVFGGGLAYWCGFILNQRVAVVAGATTLVASLGLMLDDDYVEPLAMPFLAFMALLAFALKRVDRGFWQYLGWTAFIGVVLALGFRVIPFFEPVATVQTVEHLYRFPPEKAVLLLLVPPMVLVPWAIWKADKSVERPWLVSLCILGVISVQFSKSSPILNGSDQRGATGF